MLAARSGQTLDIKQRFLGRKAFQRPHRVVVLGAEDLQKVRLFGGQRRLQGLLAARGGQGQIHRPADLPALGLAHRRAVGAQDEPHRLTLQRLLQGHHPAAAGLHRQVQCPGHGRGQKIQKPEYRHGSASKGFLQAAGRRLGRVGFK